ncbi:g4352 [Coccomyxa elongata]
MREKCHKSCGVTPDCTPKESPKPWPGRATADGTRLFSTMYPGAYHAAEHHWRRDPAMGEFYLPGQQMRGAPWLHLSSLGVGTYLGERDARTDEQVTTAIIASVHRGWNCIDTASNYRNSRAERSVGAALNALFSGNVGITRDMLLISTKAGYIADDIADNLMIKGSKNGGIVTDYIVGGNCIHPNCLDASLKRSLSALNLAMVDILYLHNAAESHLGGLGNEAFLKRLREAFAWLEGARKEGKIAAYGMATWDCFRKAPERGGLQLQDIVKLAESVGGRNHGFRYVQLPINARMREAWEQEWQAVEVDGQTQKKTFMEAAARLGVGVFASAPLLEGELLKDEALRVKLDEVEELALLHNLGVKLLQISRSTPFLTTALIGHKAAKNADANVRLIALDPLNRDTFHKVMAQIDDGGKQAIV